MSEDEEKSNGLKSQSIDERRISRPRYQTGNPFNYKYLKAFQKNLKKNSTEAEQLLWKELQNKKIGFKFRRQHVISDMIVDFICIRQKLVVEVDGKIHLKQIDEDSMRTQRLNTKGYRVIRFTNDEVIQSAETVAQKIKQFLESSEAQVH
jgi:very-short-patch-repair endonuclease